MMEPGNNPPRPEDFEDLFEHSLSGHIIAAPDGKILRANQRLARWTGTAAEAMQNHSFTDLLTIGGKIYYETHLWPLLRMQGYFEEVALELSCAGGEKMPVLVHAQERRDGQNKPVFIRFTIFRATDRRIYEQNLIAANEKLQSSIAGERELVQLREQLIAILGHDLRNPLGSILAGSGFLVKAALPDAELRIARRVHQSSLRMAELIRNIMDFARTRLGDQLILNKQPTFLQPVLQQVIDELSAQYPHHQIKVNFNLTEPVYCDAPRIAQLASNLLANALSHGAADKPVMLEAFHRNGVFRLTVSNAGPAISAERRATLFQPFSRGNSGSLEYGLGLGLFIVSQIAVAHGGQIAVQSSEEETSFSFQLGATDSCAGLP